jgi:hypothetical protein
VSTLKKIRIKRFPPLHSQRIPKALLGRTKGETISERDKECLMLFKANPNHPVVIQECSEIVEIAVDDNAFRELTWLFKKYRIPFKPTKEGVEIKHVKAHCSY